MLREFVGVALPDVRVLVRIPQLRIKPLHQPADLFGFTRRGTGKHLFGVISGPKQAGLLRHHPVLGGLVLNSLHGER